MIHMRGKLVWKSEYGRYIVHQMFFGKTVCCLLLLAVVCDADEYVIDNSVGHGRRFDGVGAISGGGVR